MTDSLLTSFHFSSTHFSYISSSCELLSVLISILLFQHCKSYFCYFIKVLHIRTCKLPDRVSHTPTYFFYVNNLLSLLRRYRIISLCDTSGLVPKLYIMHCYSKYYDVPVFFLEINYLYPPKCTCIYSWLK